MTTPWEQTLDELEARVASSESSELVTASPFSPPVDLGPLPGELSARAQAIIDRGDAAVKLAEAEMERLRAELRRLPRHPARPPETGSFRARA